MTAQQPILDEPGILKTGGISPSSTWHLRNKERGFPDPLLDLMAARFRLLGEPLRLKLLALLMAGECNVGELVVLTGAGQANVSKHLATLTQGGLVSRRKVGTSIYYAIADPTVSALCDVVCAGMQERFTVQAHALGLHTTLKGAGDRQRTDKEKEDTMEV